MIKELIRRVIYVLTYFGSGEFKAEPGTLKYRFLDWLYGNAEPEFDVQWPENTQ